MTMGVKVYYSEISGSKEVKKRQQRVMMILDSKGIPYEPIDITEAGKESSKDFMLKNAKPKGDTKIILSPQIFSDELYCGDYDDFDLANENDVLEAFLNSPKIEKNVPAPTTTSSSDAAAPAVVAEANPAENEAEAVAVTNGNAASRESSAEAEEAKKTTKEKSASPERDTESAAVAADTTTAEAPEVTESTGDDTKGKAAADEEEEEEEADE